jgi:hypothetical protein
VSDKQFGWMLRAAITLVLLLAQWIVFSSPSFPEKWMNIAYPAALALPWLVALFIPSSKIEFAAALLIGSSLIVVPLLIFLLVLSLLSDVSSAPLWFFTIVMAATTLLGLVAGIRNLARHKTDIWMLLIVGLGTWLYEDFVIRWGSELSRNRRW